MISRRLAMLGAAALASVALTVPALAQDTRTFTIWWYEPVDSAQTVAWNAALEELKAMHPGLTVNFELKTFDQIRTAGAMIINSDAAPDLLEYNKGNGTAGLLATQGVLEQLDDVAKERGWDKVLTDATTMLGRYDENGIFGSGPLIGVSNYGEFVGVFYNQEMFAENNIAVPTTLAEMEAAMDVFVAKGITPIAQAANDHPAQHLMYSLALSKADNAWVDSFQGLKAPLDPAPFIYAAEKLQEWVNKGYMSKDSTGMKSADAQALFTAGTSPMFISGTWNWGGFKAVDTFTVGEFLFPDGTIKVGSTGNIWVVPKTAKNKDLAYDFIGITLTKENQAILGNAGGLPIAADPADLTDETGKTIVALFNDMSANNGLGLYPDWPVPGFYDVMLQSTQAVIGGTLSPEDFGARIKEAYDEVQAEQ